MAGSPGVQAPRPVYAAILAGGQGTRLWPLSRQALPKQFLPLAPGGESLLQAAARRALALCGDLDHLLVIALASNSDMVRQHLPDLPAENLLGEPAGRNTAAALCLAAYKIHRRDPQAVMLALPADHLFPDERPWLAAVGSAVQFASQNQTLVATGIPPTQISTSYGYLKTGRQLAQGETGCPVFAVEQFVEKPAERQAEEFVRSGQYLWNTGTYAWQVSVFIDELSIHLPATSRVLEQIAAQPAILETAYPALENISVDYAVLEKSRRVAVVRGDFQRLDIGALASLGSLLSNDPQGNAAQGDVIAIDSQGNILYTDQGLIGLVGMQNLIVIRQGDVVLVCPKERAAEVKNLVASLDQKGLEQYK